MKSTPCRSRVKSAAFTLTEVLVVIAIIGVLTAIAIPVIGNVRQSAASSRALTNVKQLALANLLYAQDNKNKLLGLRDGAQSWNGLEFFLNQTAAYLLKTPGGNQEVTINAHRGLVDPLVPEEHQLYSNTYYHTWAINRLFNVNGGRAFDGTGSWFGGPNGTGRPRLLVEFSSPAQTIYAVSGGYELTTNNAANPELVNTPTGRQGIFYYHRGGSATPAVFLDGHAELLTYPIDPTLIRPPS